MEYVIITFIAFAVVLILGLIYSRRFLKKKREIALKERQVPEDLLDTFDYVEAKMKGGLNEDGTTNSPYKILWEEARRDRGTEEDDRSSDRGEQANVTGELSKQPIKRQDIPVRVTTTTDKDTAIVRKHKQNNFGRVISRIRRRS